MIISKQIKSFIFAVFFVTANLLSLYSITLVAGAQAATPQPPKPPDQPANGSVPNNGNNPITNPGQLNNLGNTLNGMAGQNAQLESLVQQAAANETQSYQNIDDNLNSSLATTDSAQNPDANADDPESQIAALSNQGSLLQQIQQLTASFLNTGTNQGNSTSGFAGQWFEGMQGLIYYTIGGGWIPKLGWIFAQYTQDFVSEWLGRPSVIFSLLELWLLKTIRMSVIRMTHFPCKCAI